MECYFDDQTFDYNVLHPEDYIVPFDFEDNRQLFLNSDFGQEQIFSIYVTVKNSCNANIFRGAHFPQKLKRDTQMFAVRLFSKLKRLKWIHIYKLAQRLFSIVMYKQRKSEVVLGVIGSFFSERNFVKLQNRSRNTIRNLQIPFFPKNNLINETDRELIASKEIWFDDFDFYFFSSMKTCFPRICLEDFKNIEKNCDSFLDKFPLMRYIVSEAWLSDSYINVLLAFAKNRNILHIYNEHNCIFYPFEGDYMKQVAQLCDVYATVGWKKPIYPNIIPTASLYDYGTQRIFKKKYKILYIGVPFMVKMHHYSSAWGFSGENVPRFLEFITQFFSALETVTLGEISYRPYPPQNLNHILIYNKEGILKNFVSSFREFTDTRESSKFQMQQSSLVVIDYISTSYLECLHMNIPFILFWDKDSYFLKEEFKDYFTSLEEAGICHSNAQKVAQFIEQIKDDPDIWWFSCNVQKARKLFIERNFGNPELMVDYLLSLTRDESPLTI